MTQKITLTIEVDDDGVVLADLGPLIAALRGQARAQAQPARRRRRGDTRAEVLGVLADGKAHSTTTIQSRSSGSPGAVSGALARLVAENRVTRLGSGIYRLAGRRRGPVLGAVVIVYSMGGATRCPGVRVIDVLALPNPYAVRALRPLDGRRREVQEWVLARGGRAVLDDAARLVQAADLEAVGFRCMGGRHRSVALAELLVARLAASGRPDARAVHLDLT